MKCSTLLYVIFGSGILGCVMFASGVFGRTRDSVQSKFDYCDKVVVDSSGRPLGGTKCFDECYLATIGSEYPNTRFSWCMVDRCDAHFACKEDHSITKEHPNGVNR